MAEDPAHCLLVPAWRECPQACDQCAALQETVKADEEENERLDERLHRCEDEWNGLATEPLGERLRSSVQTVQESARVDGEFAKTEFGGAREPLLDRLDDAGDRGSQRLRLLCQRGSEQESTENQQADQDQVEHEDNGDPRKTEASLQPIDERVDQVREDCGDDEGGEDMGEVEQGPAENERDERGDEKEFTGLPDTIEHMHAVRTRPVPALCLASGGRIARSTGAFYRSRTRVALRARTAC